LEKLAYTYIFNSKNIPVYIQSQQFPAEMTISGSKTPTTLLLFWLLLQGHIYYI